MVKSRQCKVRGVISYYGGGDRLGDDVSIGWLVALMTCWEACSLEEGELEQEAEVGGVIGRVGT